MVAPTTPIPFTLSILLNTFYEGASLPHDQTISLLLSNGLTLEASFLIHQGVPPHLCNLVTALDFHHFPFAIEFIKSFLP